MQRFRRPKTRSSKLSVESALYYICQKGSCAEGRVAVPTASAGSVSPVQVWAELFACFGRNILGNLIDWGFGTRASAESGGPGGSSIGVGRRRACRRRCCARPQLRVRSPRPGGVDGRFTPEMPVIRMPGQWVRAALRTGDRPAALSCGRSYWAHRFFGSEIENKNHWAGQVVVPPFWSCSGGGAAPRLPA